MDELFRVVVRGPTEPPAQYRRTHITVTAEDGTQRPVDDVDPAAVTSSTQLQVDGRATLRETAVRPAPHELVLRHLIPLDPTSPQDVMQFLADHDLPALPRLLTRPPSTPTPPTIPDPDDPNDHVGDFTGLLAAESRPVLSLDDRPHNTIGMSEAQWRLALYRALALHILALPTTITAQTLADAAPQFAAAWAPTGLDPRHILDVSDGPLISVITVANILSAMLARPAAVQFVEPSTPTAALVGRPDRIGDVFAIELAGLLNDRDAPRTCERCDSWFVVQSGRPGVTRDGTRRRGRSDARFCSGSCASASASAAYRRRQREAASRS